MRGNGVPRVTTWPSSTAGVVAAPAALALARRAFPSVRRVLPGLAPFFSFLPNWRRVVEGVAALVPPGWQQQRVPVLRYSAGGKRNRVPV